MLKIEDCWLTVLQNIIFLIKQLFSMEIYRNWSGSRKATDEYFEKMGLKPFLHRIDYTGRIMQKF